MRTKREMVFSSFSSSSNRPLTEIQLYIVPVIAIFTKFDDLVKQVYDPNLKMADNRQVALSMLEAKFKAPLSKLKFPPKAYLRLESAFNVLVFVRVWRYWLDWYQKCKRTTVTTRIRWKNWQKKQQTPSMISHSRSSLFQSRRIIWNCVSDMQSKSSCFWWFHWNSSWRLFQFTTKL